MLNEFSGINYEPPTVDEIVKQRKITISKFKPGKDQGTLIS